jgi:high-affinity iron transporter
VTNVLIALLAASLGSQLARALSQAGFLEAWTTPLWDSSHVLAQDSAFGTFLHALVGYDARPSAAQMVAYLAVLAFIYVGNRLMTSRPRPGPIAR